MSEPFLERLSRFTPDAGGLDRDALLFAAGRVSARRNRGWMTVASLLAGTQALSLIFLWPHPSPPTGLLTYVPSSPRCPSRPRLSKLGPRRRGRTAVRGRPATVC